MVDLGCNGGHLLVALTTAGFKAIGVDVSAPALALAAENHAASKTTLRGYQRLYVCICAHGNGARRCYVLPNKRRAPCVEEQHRPQPSLSRAGTGQVFFDVVDRAPANRYQYRNHRAGHDWRINHCVLENRDGTWLYRDIAIDHQVSGRWRRSRETHRLYLHTPYKIAQRLQQCGFSVYMADAIGPVETLPRRVAFICRKAAC